MADRPNIVLICTDQQRYDSLGCTGNPFALTPHLDALAGEGTLCRRYFTANAVCMPSRATILSGLYPASHGVWTNGVPMPRRGYIAETSVAGGGLGNAPSAVSQVDTLADVLAGAGYATASVGKLHLTPTSSHVSLGYEECRARWNDPAMADWHGPYYGFQHVEMSIGHGVFVHGHYGQWLETNFPGVAAALATWKESRPFASLQLFTSPVSVEAHHSTWCGLRAAEYIRGADRQRPYLLWVGLPDPHHPFAPPAELAGWFEQRPATPPGAPGMEYAKPRGLKNYMDPRRGWSCPPEAVRRVRQYTDAMVHLIDRAVGRIAQALKDAGQWENTVLAFTSDHGDYLGDYGLVYKTSHASAGLNHVPLIVRAPGASLPREVATTLGAADLAPTLCALAGVPAPGGMQGEALPDVLAGGRRRLVRGEDYPGNDPAERNLTVYDDRFRYTWYPATNERELYDHAVDPAETRNLAAEPGRAAHLARLHDALCTQFAGDFSPNFGRACIW